MRGVNETLGGRGTAEGLPSRTALCYGICFAVMQIHIAAVSPLDFSVWWMLRGAFNCTLVLLLSGASILKSPGQKMLHVPRNPQGMSRFQWIHFFSLIFIPFLKQVFSDNYFSAYHLPNVLFHHNERYHCTFVPPSAPYLIPIKVPSAQ